jgi:hypothetical protein
MLNYAGYKQRVIRRHGGANHSPAPAGISATNEPPTILESSAIALMPLPPCTPFRSSVTVDTPLLTLCDNNGHIHAPPPS